jgi:alkylation response protein AidB-like acyl-CoA dehydrogenase
MRGVLLSPDDVVIEDTWTATGLCATASHHFHVDGLRVPADRTFVPLAGEPCIDDPIVRFPTPSTFALGVASVALGIGRGALDDLVEIAAGKVPLLAPATLATNPRFQWSLATADTELRAARTLVHEVAAAGWAAAVDRTPITVEQVARMRAAAAWATDRAAAVVDTAHRLAGSSAVYADSALQRRLRDVHTVAEHFLVKPDTMTTAGAVLAGQDPLVPVF